MNSPFVLEQAQRLAARALEGSPQQRVRALYRLALERDPAPEEIDFGVKFIASQQQAVDGLAAKTQPPPKAVAATPVKPGKPVKGKQPTPPAPPPPLSPWAMYAQVLLLTNEFMFVD